MGRSCFGQEYERTTDCLNAEFQVFTCNKNEQELMKITKERKRWVKDQVRKILVVKGQGNFEDCKTW